MKHISSQKIFPNGIEVRRFQEWLCKLILWFVIYFQVASVLWMLIEGAYLYSRFTVFAMRHNDAPWGYYMACGWGKFIYDFKKIYVF